MQRVIREPWTPAERKLLDALLDVILPPTEAGMPAGSALPVAEYLAARCADTAGLGELLHDGLHKAAALVRERGGAELGVLPEAERTALVTTLEQTEASFFRAFVRHAFMGYYTQPSVPPRLGLPSHPPQPLGHEVPRDEQAVLEALLAPVRARGQRYRDAG